MGKNNNKNFDRETNVSTKVKADKVRTKVNGGVFTYTGAITVGELSKTLENEELFLQSAMLSQMELENKKREEFLTTIRKTARAGESKRKR